MKGPWIVFGLNTYLAVQSLEQGYERLMKDTNNVILGGTLWMKMGRKQYDTGIDLSNLGLNRIEENGDAIEMGCMTTLRQMESSPLLQKWFGPVFSQAFRFIVGVQFRNLATLGGSVYSRFGFSDVITALTALDARVELYKGGVMSLSEFLGLDRKRDILVRVILPKQAFQTSYQTLRKSATDFPVLSVAVSRRDGKWAIALGARPARAVLASASAGLLPPDPDPAAVFQTAEAAVKEVSFGTDQRGSRAYREILAKTLVQRGISALCG